MLICITDFLFPTITHGLRFLCRVVVKKGNAFVPLTMHHFHSIKLNKSKTRSPFGWMSTARLSTAWFTYWTSLNMFGKGSRMVKAEWQDCCWGGPYMVRAGGSLNNLWLTNGTMGNGHMRTPRPVFLWTDTQTEWLTDLPEILLASCNYCTVPQTEHMFPNVFIYLDP